MRLRPITISVSPATVRAFRAASETDRKFAGKLLELFFVWNRPVGPAEFRKLADKAHDEAIAHGLTEGILQQILEEE